LLVTHHLATIFKRYFSANHNPKYFSTSNIFYTTEITNRHWKIIIRRYSILCKAQNPVRKVQNLCPDLFKAVRACLKLSRHVQSCTNVSEAVQTSSKLYEFVWSWPNLFGAVLICLLRLVTRSRAVYTCPSGESRHVQTLQNTL